MQDADHQLIIRREQIRQEYLTYFRSLNLDIILLPAGPAPAQMLGTTKYWSYTSLFNLLDWPGAVFPTGLYVDPKLDLKGDHGYEGRNEDERHLYKTCKH
jgi:Asp-tRNA(Asn)/Glu-tRNA(Gln) amidotransferase A subunit family amidase